MISRIINVSLRVIGFGFWILQKPHPIIVQSTASHPISKASISDSHFHSYFFSFFIFPRGFLRSVIYFFLCYLLRELQIIKNKPMSSHNTARTASRIVHSTKLNPVQRGSCIDGLPNTDFPLL